VSLATYGVANLVADGVDEPLLLDPERLGLGCPPSLVFL
jgi:hypothetical protein